LDWLIEFQRSLIFTKLNMSQNLIPPRIHILAKPSCATCNLACSYCFFLDKELLYPNSKFRMTEETLEAYIKQLIETHRSNQVTVAWQGGEPTLMGVEFYHKAIKLQEKYRKPGMTFENTMQTNGTLLDDEWCEFFKENDFLIGLSLGGRHGNLLQVEMAEGKVPYRGLPGFLILALVDQVSNRCLGS
jgi:uncharacterized protein